MRDLGSFGREPAPPDPEPLLQAILAFVRARTWSESRRVVEERPELLSDAADALLGQLIAAQEDADVRRYLEERRALLRRCREVGVERAFREKTEALARSLSAAPSEEEIRRHPLYQLAEMVLRGELTLEAARQRAIAPDTLRALDDRSIDRMNDYIIALSRDPARPIGTRIRAYVLAELNHAAAQALPASPPIRADTASTLGNRIHDYPFKTPAHLERRVEAYREALAIWQQEGDPRRVAMLQNNLGNAYQELAAVRDREGNLERAIAAYREALRFRTPETAPLEYAMTQNNLGNAYQDLAAVRDREGNLERAIAAYREALRFRTPETAPLEYAMTQNNLGNAYQDLAAVRDREGNLERAIAAYREALRFRTPETAPLGYATTQNNLGNAYQDLAAVRDREGNLERAIAAYREALTVYTPETAPLDYAMTQNNLGTAYQELAAVRDREGNLERAIAAYREALGMIDRFFVTASVAAQLGLQEAWSGLYARAVEACHRAGQPALAFAIAEGSKSRLLTGLLGRSDLPAPAILPAELVEQERALTGRLNALDAAALARHGQTATTEDETPRLKLLEERQALLEQLQALWQKMETLDPRASDYVALRRGDRPSWEDLSRLAESLGPQTALLSLFTTGQRILLFVLRAGWERPQAVEVPLTLDELRYVYLANYEDEILHRSSHRQAGRPLTHRWRGLGRPLLSPVLPYLEGITHLVIAPAGWFHLLPLHALDLDGSGETLLDRCAVAYVPALGLLERLRRREPAVAGKAVVLGYTPADLTTRRGRVERQLFLGEAQAVARQMGVRPLLDREATAPRLREALADQTLRLVHLSCHGHFDPTDPLRSGVLLADGLFTARQWMELRFRAGLVTLSACGTGLTGFLGGDELAGLSQALLYAGASSLLVSLWSVDALTTASLMVDFYRRLWDESGNKKTDTATALREATLALRKGELKGELLPPAEGLDPSDPYYWAPFILVGDWR
jgi:CHAT domain-containing protein